MEVFLTTNVTPEAENNGHAKNMLNLVEALWYQHALRERHFDAWLTLLSHAQRREVSRAESLSLSVAVWPPYSY